METLESLKEKANLFNWRLTLKMVTIGVVAILLLIPKLMITSLIDERNTTAEAVKMEVMQKWSLEQHLRGPVLTVPYKDFSVNEKGEPLETIRTLYLLPEKLNLEATVFPRDRHRSIYQVVVYESDIDLNGTFVAPDYAAMKISPQAILWDKAELSVALSDLRGINSLDDFLWNGKPFSFSPGMDKGKIGSTGITVSLSLDPAKDFPGNFSSKLHLKGSHSLQFAPLGKVTETRVRSTWKAPGFTGNFLPANYEITPEGFNAYWKILHFNRTYPQSWSDERFDLSGTDYGVEMVTVADQYQKNTRSAKYGILVILLIFLAFFLNEMITGERIHPFQYTLVGSAILLFYLLLLSISEHTGFNIAYLLASLAVLLLVFAYSRSFIQKVSHSLGLVAILTTFFGFIFILLQLESFALLTGSIGLFLILALTMYFTRKINWYRR